MTVLEKRKQQKEENDSLIDVNGTEEIVQLMHTDFQRIHNNIKEPISGRL